MTLTKTYKPKLKNTNTNKMKPGQLKYNATKDDEIKKKKKKKEEAQTVCTLMKSPSFKKKRDAAHRGRASGDEGQTEVGRRHNTEDLNKRVKFIMFNGNRGHRGPPTGHFSSLPAVWWKLKRPMRTADGKVQQGRDSSALQSISYTARRTSDRLLK